MPSAGSIQHKHKAQRSQGHLSADICMATRIFHLFQRILSYLNAITAKYHKQDTKKNFFFFNKLVHEDAKQLGN